MLMDGWDNCPGKKRENLGTVFSLLPLTGIIPGSTCINLPFYNHILSPPCPNSIKETPKRNIYNIFHGGDAIF